MIKERVLKEIAGQTIDYSRSIDKEIPYYLDGNLFKIILVERRAKSNFVYTSRLDACFYKFFFSDNMRLSFFVDRLMIIEKNENFNYYIDYNNQDEYLDQIEKIDPSAYLHIRDYLEQVKSYFLEHPSIFYENFLDTKKQNDEVFVKWVGL